MYKTLSETFWPSTLFTFTTLTAVHVHQFLNLISANHVFFVFSLGVLSKSALPLLQSFLYFQGITQLTAQSLEGFLPAHLVDGINSLSKREHSSGSLRKLQSLSL